MEEFFLEQKQRYLVNVPASESMRVVQGLDVRHSKHFYIIHFPEKTLKFLSVDFTIALMESFQFWLRHRERCLYINKFSITPTETLLKSNYYHKDPVYTFIHAVPGLFPEDFFPPHLHLKFRLKSDSCIVYHMQTSRYDQPPVLRVKAQGQKVLILRDISAVRDHM